jgi:hypothetical protein
MQNMKLQPEGACLYGVPEYRIGGDQSAGMDDILQTAARWPNGSEARTGSRAAVLAAAPECRVLLR